MRKATKHFDRWSIVHRHNRMWTRIVLAELKGKANRINESRRMGWMGICMLKVHKKDRNDSHECYIGGGWSYAHKRTFTHTCMLGAQLATKRTDSKWSDFIRSGSYLRTEPTTHFGVYIPIVCRNAWIFSRIVQNNEKHGHWSMRKIHFHPCVRPDFRFTRARNIGLCDYSKDIPRTVKIWLKHGPSLTCLPIQCFG